MPGRVQSKRCLGFASAKTNCLTTSVAHNKESKSDNTLPNGKPRTTHNRVNSDVCIKSASKNQPTSEISGKANKISSRPKGRPGRGCTHWTSDVQRAALQSKSMDDRSPQAMRGTAEERNDLQGCETELHITTLMTKPTGATRNHFRANRPMATRGLGGSPGVKNKYADKRKSTCVDKYPSKASVSLQSHAGGPGSQKMSKPRSMCKSPSAMQVTRTTCASMVWPRLPSNKLAKVLSCRPSSAQRKDPRTQSQIIPTRKGNRATSKSTKVVRSRVGGRARARASTRRKAEPPIPGANLSSNDGPKTVRTSSSEQLLGEQRLKSKGCWLPRKLKRPAKILCPRAAQSLAFPDDHSPSLLGRAVEPAVLDRDQCFSDIVVMHSEESAICRPSPTGNNTAELLNRVA
mmetsp:Transcript_43806/g.140440  ORF Transcript_43806/g.140440 Transcript_43806/m.140440 type:complete len:404 (-) Transcript_43806:664-1875(-)